MLPEHVEMVQNLWKEDNRIEKPLMDEQQIEEMSCTLQRAMSDGISVEVQYHNGFDFSFLLAKVIRMDVGTRKIEFFDQKNREDITIKFDDICNVIVL
ncbi:YolD-like family protein [Halobacillus mangrovi]|uniref:YolD-like family protein n=1 Tax=Halobacillus mangrovi TaxID=402384 RepID=UPI003D97352C